MRLRRVIRTIFSNVELAAGTLIVLAFVVVAVTAPLLAPPDPESDSPYSIPRDGFGAIPEPPEPGHLLGTLNGGYDVFYGLVWGTHAALRMGVLVTLGRALLGVLVGLVSGFYGGLLDAAIMRITDAFLAFPVMAAVMVVVALYGDLAHQQWWGSGEPILGGRIERLLVTSLVVFGWMPYARLMRANVLVEREREYVQAATSLGATNGRILFRHLLPNVTQGLFVLLASDVGGVVGLAAAFTFIGLAGLTFGEMVADWGQMLSSARDWIIGAPGDAFKYWYTYLVPSLAIVLFSVGWGLIGDGLRDVLDPRLKQRRRF